MNFSVESFVRQFRKFFTRLFAMIRAFLGSWNYSPPPWLNAAREKYARTRLAAWQKRREEWVRAHPRKATYFVVGSLATLLIGLITYQQIRKYLDSRPQPDYALVSLSAPREPDLETGKAQDLVLMFSRSAAPTAALDQPVTKFISLSPAVKGAWHWVSDKTLVFSPENKDEAGKWQIGKKYAVELNKKLVASHVLLKETDYEFETPQLRGSVIKSIFYQDPRDPKIKRVVATLDFNYAIDTEDFKKRVSFTLQTKDSSILGEKAKRVPFTVTFNKFQNQAFLSSDPLTIPNESSVMKVKTEKGVHAARGGGLTNADVDLEVDVPGMYDYFRFESQEITFARNDKYEPEQILILKTKGEVASEVIAQKLDLELLPLQNPDQKTEKRRARRFDWSSPSEVTPAVQTLLKPVKFTLVPSAEPISTVHTFKIEVPVNRQVLVKVPKGLVSYGGYKLAMDAYSIVRAPDYPKELIIMSQGSILSLSGDKKIALLGRNVKKVRFRISRVIPAQLNQFVYQVVSRGDFSKPEMYDQSEDTMTEIFTKDVVVPFKDAASTQYFSLDLEPYLQNIGGIKKGLFYVTVDELQNDRETTGLRDRRFILLTDLGVVVKESNGQAHDVFVQNLRTGQPVVGAEVDVLGTNGISILEAKTATDGRASFPDLSSFSREKMPLAFVVKQGGDLSFLPFRMGNRKLSFSQFDVGGFQTDANGDDLNAFLFSDRGIYRPGDTANLGLMVRSQNWKRAFKDVPIVWTVTDARGTEILRLKRAVGSSDLTALTFKTEESSPTGTYSVRIFITRKNNGEEQIGSADVRIEEFQPDRMRVTAKLSEERLEGWVNPDNLKGLVTLKNLFGTPAEDRRVKGHLILTPTRPYFNAFKTYRFAAPRPDTQEKTFEETLEETKTDAKGEATFPLNLARFSAGIWSLRFDAEGFEAAGGRGVSASSGVLVSALSSLIGIRSDGELAYLKKDSAHDIELIAVNSQLKKVAAKDLKLTLIEKRYVSALMQQPDGTYKYQSVLKEIPGEAKAFQIPEAGTKYQIPTDKPGEWLLVFKDKTDTELNRIGFSIAAEANLTRSLEKSAELQLVLNRRDFQPGQEIEMQIKAPYVGAGLITIERDKVYASKWFKTSTTSTLEKIKIPEGLEGNAYVNVTFLRAIDSQEIFMSPLSYAVQPFSVSLDEHKIAIKLEVPARVKPGEKLRVQYSASRPTKFILYGVDEGILQVANYKLPDPLTYFFRRRALQVKTYQLLDLLLPEYSIVQGMGAPGGDQEGRGLLGRNLNPFKRKSDKPVVFWSGVIDAGPDKKDFVYEVPDSFNGNIKIMAVATNGPSFGSTETSSLSRGDFILTPSIPLFVAPGDEFELGLGVSNQAEGSGASAKVKVEVDAPDFEIIGESSRSVSAAEGRESSTSFRLKAKSKLGSSAIRFRASLGDKSAKASTEASIRPAMPFYSELTSGYMEKTSTEVSVPRRLLTEYREQRAGLSPLPFVLGQGLKQFLDGYPYGCTEQLTSKTFPYVILKSRTEFGVNPVKANEMFQGTLALLRSRQTNEGGFALYTPPGENRGATLYAVHLLLEAKDRGFNVPDDLLTRALDQIQRYREVSSLPQARQFAYSLYLQARSGRVPGGDVGFLRKALDTNYKDSWPQDLAAGFLASTYKLLKQDEEGRGVFRKLKLGSAKVVVDYDNYYDASIRDTALIYLAARHFQDLVKDFADDKSLRLAFEPLMQGQFNTHSAAWSLLAMDAMASTPEILKNLALEEIGPGNQVKPLMLPSGLAPMASFSATAEKLRFTAPPNYPFYYMIAQSGFDRDLPKTEMKKNLEVARDYLNAKGEVVHSAKVGETLDVRLRLRSLDAKYVNNVVLVDLLPGGFEAVLERIELQSNNESNDESRHENEDSPPPPNEDGDIPPTDLPEFDEGARNDWLELLVPRAFAEAASQIQTLSPNYIERREDRLVVYTSASRDLREFHYKVKAVSQGQFVVPPPFAESMYDRSIQFRGLSATFKVEAP